jgi:hypothetical protein
MDGLCYTARHRVESKDKNRVHWPESRRKGYTPLSSFLPLTPSPHRPGLLSGNRGARHHLYITITHHRYHYRPPNDDSMPQREHEPSCRNRYIKVRKRKGKKNKDTVKKKSREKQIS